jgi:hypothetical protein
MKESKDKDILERVLAHFEQVAPAIVKESVDSLTTDKPIIDLFDIDYYMDKMTGLFAGIDEEKLREVAAEHIEEINAIFLKHFKKVSV